MMTDIFSTPPLFVNDEGVKWWADESSTRYAHRVAATGVPLKNHKVYYVEFANGERSRVIVDQQKGVPVYDHPQVDAIATSIGFENVYSQDFSHVNTNVELEDTKETFYVMANRELGIFLVLSTFTWENREGVRDLASRAVNSAEIFFCWKPHDLQGHSYTLRGSGSFHSLDKNEDRWAENRDLTKLFWCGYNDVRQGFRTQIEALKEAGTFYKQWPAFGGRRELHLNHWADYRVYDSNKIGWTASMDAIRLLEKDRFSKFPEWAKEIVNGNVWS